MLDGSLREGCEFFERSKDGSLSYDPSNPDDPEIMTVEV